MINLVVALPAEARPLIRHYHLWSREPRGLFPVHENETIRLVVCGAGKVSAAAATAFLQATGDHAGMQGWLNVGVAGHAEQAIGEGLLAHRITDQATGRQWYPPLVIDRPPPSGNLTTLDQAGPEYPDETMLDMEASGYYPIACRDATAELVHSYKVISDNRQSPAGSLNAARVEDLVSGRLEEIDTLITQVSELAHELRALHAAPPELELFEANWRFSVSQRHQLRRLLKRWHLILPGESAWSGLPVGLRHSREVIACLEERIGVLMPDVPRHD